MTLFAFSSELPFTALLNRLFGGVATAVLEVFGVHPHDAHAPIANWFSMQLFTVIFLTACFVLLRMRLSVESPGGFQHVFEWMHGFVTKQSHEMIHHHPDRFTPFLLTLGLFILTMNLIGMVPTFESPTAHPFVPLGCALVTFAYYNFWGIREHGFGYAKQFMGPVSWLAPLMLPIEIFSHLARVMSLTVRLYANIFAGDMVTLVFFSLIPIAVPVVFLGLHVLVSFIQTFIFVLLATVYIGMAMEAEH